MKTASESVVLRCALVFCLCTGEGVLIGFVLFTLSPWLQEQGLGAASAGAAIGFMMLPFGFKVLWGWIDRYRSSRLGEQRPWMLVGYTGMAAAMIAFAAVGDPIRHLAAITLIGALAMAFMSLQNVATDGFLVTGVPERERSTVNTCAFIGQLCGLVLATTVVASALRAGWYPMSMTMTGILFLLLLAPVMIRERRQATPGHVAHVANGGTVVRPGLLAALRPLVRGQSLLALAVGLGFRTMVQIAVTSDTTLTVSLGWTAASFSLRFGAAFAGGVILGGIAAALLGRSGRYTRVLAGAAVAFAVPLIAFGLARSTWDERWIFLARWFVTGIAVSAGTVALYSVFQRFAEPALAALHMSIYTSVINLGAALGSWIAAASFAVDPQFEWTYLVIGLVALLAATLTPWMSPDSNGTVTNAKRRKRAGVAAEARRAQAGPRSDRRQSR